MDNEVINYQKSNKIFIIFKFFLNSLRKLVSFVIYWFTKLKNYEIFYLIKYIFIFIHLEYNFESPTIFNDFFMFYN